MSHKQSQVESTAVALAEFYADAARKSPKVSLENMLLPLTLQLATLSVMFEETRDEADRDVLTSVMTRRRVLKNLELEMNRTRRSGLSTTILMIDLDHFKEVNDRLGHVVGDHVLVQVGRVLRDCVRETDSVGRYGGEEFIVILSGTSDGKTVSEKIRESIAAIRVHSNRGPMVAPTASVGVATFDQDVRNPDTVEELIARADEAMYTAKDLGRNRVVIA